jgi:hypothetical protein
MGFEAGAGKAARVVRRSVRRTAGVASGCVLPGVGHPLAEGRSQRVLRGPQTHGGRHGAERIGRIV